MGLVVPAAGGEHVNVLLWQSLVAPHVYRWSDSHRHFDLDFDHLLLPLCHANAIARHKERFTQLQNSR